MKKFKVFLSYMLYLLFLSAAVSMLFLLERLSPDKKDDIYTKTGTISYEEKPEISEAPQETKLDSYLAKFDLWDGFSEASAIKEFDFIEERARIYAENLPGGEYCLEKTGSLDLDGRVFYNKEEGLIYLYGARYTTASGVKMKLDMAFLYSNNRNSRLTTLFYNCIPENVTDTEYISPAQGTWIEDYVYLAIESIRYFLTYQDEGLVFMTNDDYKLWDNFSGRKSKEYKDVIQYTQNEYDTEYGTVALKYQLQQFYAGIKESQLSVGISGEADGRNYMENFYTFEYALSNDNFSSTIVDGNSKDRTREVLVNFSEKDEKKRSGEDGVPDAVVKEKKLVLQLMYDMEMGIFNGFCVPDYK